MLTQRYEEGTKVDTLDATGEKSETAQNLDDLKLYLAVFLPVIPLINTSQLPDSLSEPSA